MARQNETSTMPLVRKALSETEEQAISRSEKFLKVLEQIHALAFESQENKDRAVTVSREELRKLYTMHNPEERDAKIKKLLTTQTQPYDLTVSSSSE